MCEDLEPAEIANSNSIAKSLSSLRDIYQEDESMTSPGRNHNSSDQRSHPTLIALPPLTHSQSPALNKLLSNKS